MPHNQSHRDVSRNPSVPQCLLVVKKFVVRHRKVKKTEGCDLCAEQHCLYGNPPGKERRNLLNHVILLFWNKGHPALPTLMRPFRADLSLETTETKSSHYNLLKAFLQQTKNIHCWQMQAVNKEFKNSVWRVERVQSLDKHLKLGLTQWETSSL